MRRCGRIAGEGDGVRGALKCGTEKDAEGHFRSFNFDREPDGWKLAVLAHLG